MKRLSVAAGSLAACSLWLAACSPSGPPGTKVENPPPAPAETKAEDGTNAGEVFTWECPGGKSFTVAFDEGFTTATVTSGASIYKLPAAISASGSRYTDDKVEFWEHQGEAMLNGTPGGDLKGCKQKEAS